MQKIKKLHLESRYLIFYAGWMVGAFVVELDNGLGLIQVRNTLFRIAVYSLLLLWTYANGRE
jgi:hypothetical protein